MNARAKQLALFDVKHFFMLYPVRTFLPGKIVLVYLPIPRYALVFVLIWINISEVGDYRIVMLVSV